VELLGLTRAEDALVLVLITVTDRAEDATGNLLAPIVVNLVTMRAAQVVLPTAPVEDLRRPLWAAAPALV
jgi:flagellar assembly factor FliW